MWFFRLKNQTNNALKRDKTERKNLSFKRMVFCVLMKRINTVMSFSSLKITPPFQSLGI